MSVYDPVACVARLLRWIKVKEKGEKQEFTTVGVLRAIQSRHGVDAILRASYRKISCGRLFVSAGDSRDPADR